MTLNSWVLFIKECFVSSGLRLLFLKCLWPYITQHKTIKADGVAFLSSVATWDHHITGSAYSWARGTIALRCLSTKVSSFLKPVRRRNAGLHRHA